MKQNFLLACYNEFFSKIEYSEEKKLWIGYVLDVDDLLMFSGETLEDALQTFHSGIDEYSKVVDLDSQAKDNVEVINLIRYKNENHSLEEIMKEMENFESEEEK